MFFLLDGFVLELLSGFCIRYTECAAFCLDSDYVICNKRNKVFSCNKNGLLDTVFGCDSASFTFLLDV